MGAQAAQPVHQKVAHLLLRVLRFLFIPTELSEQLTCSEHNMSATETVADTHIEAFRPSADSVRLDGRHFVDARGRILDMRGANVGSASKV